MGCCCYDLGQDVPVLHQAVKKEKLQVLQSRSAKIINGTSYYSSATEALAQLNWDPLDDGSNIMNQSLCIKS